MSPRHEGGWWTPRGPGYGTAHYVLLRMDWSVLFGCGGDRDAATMRPKVRGDHLCPACCAVKALPAPEPAVEWLAPSRGDYHCGGCPHVIRAGERLAWAPSPGRHGVLLCETCAQRIENGVEAP